jgi:alcohol dehydrogenase class IV
VPGLDRARRARIAAAALSSSSIKASPVQFAEADLLRLLAEAFPETAA